MQVMGGDFSRARNMLFLNCPWQHISLFHTLFLALLRNITLFAFFTLCFWLCYALCFINWEHIRLFHAPKGAIFHWYSYALVSECIPGSNHLWSVHYCALLEPSTKTAHISSKQGPESDPACKITTSMLFSKKRDLTYLTCSWPWWGVEATVAELLPGPSPLHESPGLPDSPLRPSSLSPSTWCAVVPKVSFKETMLQICR